MNEKEMIEEMAEDLKNCLPSSWYWLKSVDSDTYFVAKHFYEEGYRKIPEGSVVLSKEELNDLEYKAYSRGVCLACEKVDEQKESVRKETAKEILQELYCFPHEYHEKKILELAKHYGVEVEE